MTNSTTMRPFSHSLIKEGLIVTIVILTEVFLPHHPQHHSILVVKHFGPHLVDNLNPTLVIILEEFVAMRV